MIAAFSSLPARDDSHQNQGQKCGRQFCRSFEEELAYDSFPTRILETGALVSRELPPESCSNLRNRACCKHFDSRGLMCPMPAP
jgi:hypothetical protein